MIKTDATDSARTDSVTGGQNVLAKRGQSAQHSYRALLDATIMIVDDEPTTVEILQAFLEEAGYHHFVTTTDSTQALSLLEQEKPDVLLLDVNMPQVTGFDILTAMREGDEFRHVPVLILTSSDGPDTKLEALKLGASDFLAKPVDPSELALRLRNTLAAKAYQDRLAYYDALTGLPNRKMFMERAQWELQRAARNDRAAAILHIDLDRFKEINDSLGHSVGDELLKHVSGRLMDRLRASDIVSRTGLDGANLTLSRLGGDEFIVMLTDVTSAEGISHVACRLLHSLKDPFSIHGQELFVNCSIGAAVYPEDGRDPDTLLKNAEVAMYHCKQGGRNTFEYYSREMNERSSERLTLENQLRKALEHNELQLYLQPKVDVATGRILGSEALIRWIHPEHGLIPPVKFIPLAEDAGLIVGIGEWVLREACTLLKGMHDAGHGQLSVAVNVSIRQFHDPGFVGIVKDVLTASGLAPQYLTLELTENILLKNAQENIERLQRIRDMGVKLSIDDFGTGYSSLSYLQKFPISELKIDRSFILDIDEKGRAPIVSAIIAMAKSLELKVVAEGIETAQQLEFIHKSGCDEYQGYLFGKPMPLPEFIARLEDTRKSA